MSLTLSKLWFFLIVQAQSPSPIQNSIQKLAPNFWKGKQPWFWANLIWIKRVLSQIQLYRRPFSQFHSLYMWYGTITTQRSNFSRSWCSMKLVEFCMGAFHDTTWDFYVTTWSLLDFGFKASKFWFFPKCFKHFPLASFLQETIQNP